MDVGHPSRLEFEKGVKIEGGKNGDCEEECERGGEEKCGWQRNAFDAIKNASAEGKQDGAHKPDRQKYDDTGPARDEHRKHDQHDVPFPKVDWVRTGAHNKEQ